MKGFSSVVVVGNVTRDPELRYSPQGTPIAGLGVAVTTKRGENEETSFFDAVAFGKTAEVMAQYVHKGNPILLSGRLQQRRWEDDHGNKKSKIEIIVDQLTFLGAPPGAPTDGGTS